MAVNVSEVVDKARFNDYHLLIVVLCALIVFAPNDQSGGRAARRLGTTDRRLLA